MKDPTGFLRPPSASAAAPAIALAMVLSVTACSDPLEFPAWTVPPPEGTPLREYAGVPLGERGEHIELIEDLVIGERGDDGNYRLYDAAGPVVDSEGNFYVLDAGNYRAQVFDASGEYVRTLGRQGQGPGELTQPRAVVIAGDRIVVLDSGNRRYSAWTLDGEYLGETASSDQYVPGGLQAFDDGTLLGRVIARREDDGSFNGLSTRSMLATYSAEFAKALDVQEFPPMKVPSINRVTPTSASSLRVAVPVANPSHTASRSGDIYTCLCEEYQVYAFDREATMRWALRATWERIPVTEEEIVAAMERARERMPDATRAEIDIPERKPALSHVNVDGHGHLYVFPYINDFEAAEVPVDVYSRDGDALFSGWIPAVRWSDARGDFVYGREADDQSGEERIIRYRIVEPFE